MALYYYLLHVWVRLGDSEFVVRCFSAVAGVLTVPFMYSLGRRMFGTRVALIGAAFLGANAFHIKYSQEARGYSLVVLLVTLSTLFFVRAVEHQLRNDWIGYVLTGTLAVYAHFFGVLVLAAQWASIALLRPRDVHWSRLLASMVTICVLLLPLAVFALTRDTGQLAWVSKANIHDVYGVIDSLAGGGKLLGVAYFVCCSAALPLTLRTWVQYRSSFDTWRYGLVLSWLVVPVLIAFVVSLWKPIFVDRFLIVCLPALVLLAAIGVAQIRQRWMLVSCLVVLLLLSARRIPWYRAQPEKEDWRGATSYVLTHASPKDGIIFYTSYGRLGFDYYAPRLMPGTRAGKVVFPDRLDFNAAPRIDPDDSLLGSLPQHYEQIWLVVRFNEFDPKLQERDQFIEAMLASEYPHALEKRFTGMRVLHYSGGERIVDPSHRH